jgi:hypothetical protein
VQIFTHNDSSKPRLGSVGLFTGRCELNSLEEMADSDMKGKVKDAIPITL